MIDKFLNKALDQLIITLPQVGEQRMQKRFDQVWKPTYNDLQLVHSDYYSIFQKYYSLLRAEQEVDKATEFGREQRIAFAPIRQKLTVAGGIRYNEKLPKPLSEEEQDFLREVMRYIGITSIPDWVGTRAAGQLTESERVALMDEEAVSHFFGNLKTIEKLGEQWIKVSKSFNALQFALFQ